MQDQARDDAIIALLKSPSLVFGKGCEITDLSLGTFESITTDLRACSVSHSAYATLHNTASMRLTTELDWGRVVVRPYCTFTNGTTSGRANLGAYFTNIPEYDAEKTPTTFDVTCTDILDVLNDVVGESFGLEAGVPYLDAIEDIIYGRGVRQYIIDRSAQAKVLPEKRGWLPDDQTTWLKIVNELIASIGYQGVWSDWDGRLRVQPYISPRDRAVEWTYDDDPATSQLKTQRKKVKDFGDAPNRWVFRQTNNIAGTAPVEGAGIYTYVNQFTGPTSTSARGRTITRPVGLDVADHAALVAAAQITIDADMLVPEKIYAATAPMPLHSHFDRMYVDDAKLGPPVNVLGTQWTLNLAPENTMTHEWTVI